MGKRRGRGMSLGTVLLLALTVATLAATAWLLPKFLGGGADPHIDAQRMFGDLPPFVEESNMRHQTAEEGQTAPLDPETTGEPAIGPTPAPTRLLHIKVAGSIAVPRNIRHSGFDRDTGAFAYDTIFTEVQGLLSGADLTICTVESAFAGPEYSDHNAPDAMLDPLKYAGFNLLSLGNERALDTGIEGLRTTVTMMESKGFIVTGATPRKEDVGAVRLIQVDGVQVAVLAYSYGISSEGQRRTRREDRFAIPLLDPDVIRNDIATARKAGADVVIVMPHWGTRNSNKVTPAQKALGEQLVAMGADLVVGAHPNVVQRVDRVQTEGPNGRSHEAIVAYSLGSLLSDTRDLAGASSMVMHFDFQVDTVAKTAKLVYFGYAPMWVQRDRVSSGSYVYSVLRADDENTEEVVDATTRRRMNDACITVQKVLAEGIEVPVYWP